MTANPFSSFPTVISYLNLGRHQLLKEIAQIITMPRPEHMDFHGLPGMGKTSLLRYVAQPDFIRDYQSNLLGTFRDEPNKLFIVYLSGWIKSIHPMVIFYREFYRSYGLYIERLANESPDIKPPDLGQPEALQSEDGDKALGKLEPLIRQLVDAGFRTVLLFDDFDKENAFGDLTPSQAARLSTWMPYCSFIFATERLLEEVNPSARKGSPLFKRLAQTIMREFTEGEAKLVISGALNHPARPAQDAQANGYQKEELPHKGFPAGDFEFLYKQTGGFPLQLLLGARELWDFRFRMGLESGDENGEPLPDHRYNLLASRLGVEFGPFFDSYFQAVGPDKANILIELARQEAAREERAYQNGASKGKGQARPGRQERLFSEEMDVYTIQLSALEQYGLVRLARSGDRSGDLTLFSPLFLKYLLGQSTQKQAQTGIETMLTEQQLALYDTFRKNADEVLTFADLGRKVWRWPEERNPDDIPEDEKRKIHIAVSKLRRQLDEASTGERIVSLRSKGYRFEPAR